MALDKRQAVLASGSVMGLVCLLYILSNALPYWGTVTVLAVSGNQGLWLGCSTVLGTAICLSTPSSCPSGLSPEALSVCHKLIAAKAFMTIACLLSVFSVLCIFANLTNNTNSNSMMIMICIILPVVCLVSGIIGVGLGITYINDLKVITIGAAAVLGIAAVIMNLVGAALTILIL